MSMATAQRQRPQVAHPVHRFWLFSAIAAVLLVGAVWWATDGFTSIHQWNVNWVDRDYKDTINY